MKDVETGKPLLTETGNGSIDVCSDTCMRLLLGGGIFALLLELLPCLHCSDEGLEHRLHNQKFFRDSYYYRHGDRQVPSVSEIREP